MMKGFKMNKVLDTIRRRPTGDGSPSDSADGKPEAAAGRYVKQFCTTGPNNSGDEVTFLPPIVEAAESSPAAAAECARLIKKYMGKDYWTKPSYQYNALMLLRILADNPGMTFTRNLDKKFVDVTRELLKSGRDNSVRQILMETLDSFEHTKEYDEGLGPLIELWKKEKEKAYQVYGGRPLPPPPGPRTLNAPPYHAHQQGYFTRAHSSNRLPDPVELSNRLEEARTSAKLLEQVVVCTAPGEVLSNDLIKEFADRCLSATRSVQGYMAADDPPPDNDTMESLINTNEQLQQALNQHQRAVLNARKQFGMNERSNNASPSLAASAENGQQQQQASTGSSSRSNLEAPPLPGRKPDRNGKGKATEVWDAPGPSRSTNGSSYRDEDDDDDDRDDDSRDPFRDPKPKVSGSSSSSRRAGGSSIVPDEPPRLAFEPFHPGFGISSGGEEHEHAAEAVTPVSAVSRYADEDNDVYDASPKRETAAEATTYRY